MKITHQIFLERAFKIHSDKFSYLTEYKAAKEYIKIKCNSCLYIFNQTPSNHISGKRGCPKCSTRIGALKQSKTNDQFLKQCKEKHGNKFQYLSKYTNNRSMIKIKCLNCNNVFEQLATNHLDKLCGCPDCNLVGSYNEDLFKIRPELKNSPAKLYFYKFWRVL